MHIHTHTHTHTHTYTYICIYRAFPGSTVVKESAYKCKRPWFNSWVRKIPWRRDGLPTSVLLGFPGGSDSKEFACNAGNLSSTPGLDPLEEGMATHQYSNLENCHGQKSLAGYSPWGCRVGHN